jgi:two-component system response regulator NreC
MKTIRILVVEDQELIREGVSALVGRSDHFELVARGARNGAMALRQTDLERPDVILMDISLPDMSGIDVTREIKAKFSETRILMLTVDDTERRVAAAMRAGADGYIIKTANPAELENAILTVAEGKTYLDKMFDMDKIAQAMEDDFEDESLAKLTPREREVMQLIAKGNTNQDIAERLSIGIKTVETHRSNLMRKLNLHNTAEVTAYALREGIVN